MRCPTTTKAARATRDGYFSRTQRKEDARALSSSLALTQACSELTMVFILTQSHLSKPAAARAIQSATETTLCGRGGGPRGWGVGGMYARRSYNCQLRELTSLCVSLVVRFDALGCGKSVLAVQPLFFRICMYVGRHSMGLESRRGRFMVSLLEF